MPLESTAIRHFEQNPLAQDDPKLTLRIEKLYDTSPEFTTGSEAIALFEKSLAKGNLLYLGMFNGKPICAIGCFDDGQTDTKRLQYIVVHPANRGRSISAKFIKQVTDIERKKGIRHFIAGCGAIHRVLAMYELL
ncbi:MULTISPECIES: GNAT family N-acetyltransferase [unclassified Moraxella]|uniref:GNAT family N-acetyltransferase n=1 Tax=unclassified Moraxella TaxID=2685852 RepID=UPI003AF7B1AB